jgi:phage gp45-like
MATQVRSPFKLKHPGPYLAVVKNHLDPGYMGGLEVALIKGYADNGESVAEQLVPVHYLSPFYGATSVAYEGHDISDAKKYKEVQKSYGFWMVPPDIGCTVMVIFVEGDYNQGYWFGCVQDRFQNHMVPGIAAGPVDPTFLTQAQISKYGNVTSLPVAEFNKQVAGKNGKIDPKNVSNIPKPVFEPFADALAAQGLLADNIRGLTSSSARREIPSMVFGISTPGPLDKTLPLKQGDIVYGGKKKTVPVSRLGGSSFVMDDGDEDGNNELVRIRTRTGHQILLHNTADLIYIANAKGTAWIEMTSSGQFDIYGQGNINIHSSGDFNLKADGSVNIEGQNVNIHAFDNIKVDAGKDLTTLTKNTNLTSTESLSLNSKGTLAIRAKDILQTADNSMHLRSKSALLMGSDIIGLKATQQVLLSKAGVVSDPPAPISVPYSPATGFTIRSAPSPTGGIATFLSRVPTHEPWSQHENTNPAIYSSDNVSSLVASDATSPNKPITGATSSTEFLSFKTDMVATRFYSSTPELQKAVTDMAQQFKARTGRPILINSAKRTYEDQKALWDARGTAGVFTPLNPDAPNWKKNSGHYNGIAVDTSQAAEADGYGLLKENGLYRFNPTGDPVHIQLINVPNQGKGE